MLLTLPPELVLQVLSELKPSDLALLGATCKTLSHFVKPFLYKSIIITREWSDPFHIDVRSLLLAAKSESGNLLHRAQHMTWRLPPYPFTFDIFAFSHEEELLSLGRDLDAESRIPEHVIQDDDNLTLVEREDKEHWMGGVHSLENHRKDRIMSVMIRLKENHLKSFSWDFGEDIPREILGRDGYLQMRQKNLESIRLLSFPERRTHIYHLSTFTKVTRLFWKGLVIPQDILDFKDWFQIIAPRLKSLKMDWIEYEYLVEGLEDDGLTGIYNVFAGLILQIPPRQRAIFFPQLEELAMTEISLEGAAQELASAFNWDTMKSLEISRCPSWEMFMRKVLRGNRRLHVKCLTLGLNTEFLSRAEHNKISDVCACINATEGLESFALKCLAVPSLQDLWNAIGHHSNTLKTLIIHMRHRNTTTLHVRDFTRLFHPRSIARLNDWTRNPFRDLKLNFLGLTCDPKFMQPLVSPFTMKNTLRILHIRESWINHRGSQDPRALSLWVQPNPMVPAAQPTGDDPMYPHRTSALHQFLQWAFGETGIGSIEIIAFGEFCYQPYRMDVASLYCRAPVVGADEAGSQDELKYQILNKDNALLWRKFQDNFDLFTKVPITA